MIKSKLVGVLPPLPPAPDDHQESDNDTFSAALRDQAAAVRVCGEVLYVHRHVLRTIPYFAALLDGEWNDSRAPEVDLPCRADELVLLVKRLYTNELLGGCALPVPTCASALRLAGAAAMLLIEEQLPELPELLRRSITSKEDAQLAMEAVGALPDSLSSRMQDLCGSDAISEDQLVGLVRSSTDKAQRAADAILDAHGGRMDAATLASAIKQALQARVEDASSTKWLMRVAEDHLPVDQVMTIYKGYTCRYIKCPPTCSQHDTPQSCHQSKGAIALRAAFLDYLFTCAKKGVALSEFVHWITDDQPHVIHLVANGLIPHRPCQSLLKTRMLWRSC